MLKSKQQHEYPMTVTQAAAVIGIHPDTVRYYERTGRVEPIRLGPTRMRLYLPEHIDAIRALRAKIHRHAAIAAKK